MPTQIVPTRFRAYQLGSEGSSFSYFDGTRFTLIEARLNETNESLLEAELRHCNLGKIHTLHITSWDDDHCTPAELTDILVKYRPSLIESPGYAPKTECGKESHAIISKYTSEQTITHRPITPGYISSLQAGKPFEHVDIVFHPRDLAEGSNDNSTIKLFRQGSFNVLSFGDVESADISSYIRRCELAAEVDVLILPHHGADNGFTTRELLVELNPTVTICSSNYDNQYDHPKHEIRKLLYELNIPIFTTKTGDVSIYATTTDDYRVVNLISGSAEVSSVRDFKTKRSAIRD